MPCYVQKDPRPRYSGGDPAPRTYSGPCGASAPFYIFVANIGNKIRHVATANGRRIATRRWHNSFPASLFGLQSFGGAGVLSARVSLRVRLVYTPSLGLIMRLASGPSGSRSCVARFALCRARQRVASCSISSPRPVGGVGQPASRSRRRLLPLASLRAARACLPLRRRARVQGAQPRKLGGLAAGAPRPFGRAQSAR